MIALVLCAVFVPVAFMSGVTGQLYQQFALTIAVAVVFSAINALTLSPALCALLLKEPTPARGPLGWLFRGFNYGFDRVTGGYGAVVKFLIRKAAHSMLLLVVVGGIWLLSKEVPGGFIPDEDKGVLFISFQLPEAASLQRSDAILKKVERIVAETKGVRSACAVSGYNILTSLNMPNAGLIFVGLEESYLSGLYVNDIVRFGRVFKVFLQAEPELAGSADEHQRLHLDQSGRFWIEAWTDYVGDQPRAEWLSHEEAARWYATAHWDDWRCGLSDAPQELSGLVREIGNHRVLSAYTTHGAVSCTATS